MKTLKIFLENKFLVKKNIQNKDCPFTAKQIDNMFNTPLEYKGVKIKAYTKSTIKLLMDSKFNITPEECLNFLVKVIDYIKKPMFDTVDFVCNTTKNFVGFSTNKENKNGYDEHVCNMLWDKNKKDWAFFHYRFDEDKLYWEEDKDNIVDIYGLERA